MDKMHPEVKRWFITHAKVVGWTLVVLTVLNAFMMLAGVSLGTILFNYLLFFGLSAALSLLTAWKICHDMGIPLREGLFGVDEV